MLLWSLVDLAAITSALAVVTFQSLTISILLPETLKLENGFNGRTFDNYVYAQNWVTSSVFCVKNMRKKWFSAKERNFSRRSVVETKFPIHALPALCSLDPFL